MSTESTEEERKVGVRLSLNMAADGVVDLRTVAYGLNNPIIVITPDIAEHDDHDDLVIEIETWGVGASKSDVLELANLFDVIRAALVEQGERAYDQAVEVTGADNQTHHLVDGRCTYCKRTDVTTADACEKAPR